MILVWLSWQADGDHIILMADMNVDIWKEEISTSGISLGLQESILSAYPTLLPPFRQTCGKITH